MKKVIVLFSIIMMLSCSSTKTGVAGKKPLYEILTEQGDGGATIRFFEVLTESKEIEMLQNDETMQKKIQEADLQNATFLILNMGEKTTGGYKIGVENVEETADKVIVTVKDINPEPGSMVTQAFTYPYTVVKINSRKPIEVK
ncbi:MAG TPA: protease complex subunit PrcB family protein [Flavobacterium sp.]|jgi:hypothetical protein